MKFDNKYFVKFNFSKEGIKKNFDNALKDLDIARKDKILEVKFNYAYSSLVKAGIALLSLYQMKIKSVPGHHAKLIDTVAEILKDKKISDMGNIMRSKRNMDFYGGGIEVTEKEYQEYIRFTEEVVTKIGNILSKAIDR